MGKAEENIYKYYEKRLKEYKAKAGSRLQKLLEEDLKPYLQGINALYDLYMFQNYLIDTYTADFSKYGHGTFTLFFTKSAGDIFSIRQCLMAGQLLSAASIERNLFETYLDTRLILENDTKNRAKLYEDFQRVQIWNRVQSYKKYIEEIKNDSSLNDEIRNSKLKYYKEGLKEYNEVEINKNFEKVKDNYHPKYPYHWAWKIFKDERDRNPTVEFISKKLDVYSDYLQIYSTSSLAVHNQPIMVNLIKTDRGITATPIFNETTKSISGISCNLAIEIITRILSYFIVNNYEEIEYFLNDFFKKNFIDNEK